MPQILFTEEHFISENVMQVRLSENISSKFSSFKVGLCYVNVIFKKNGTDKILVTSHSVSSYQSIEQWSIIGSYFNDNPSSQHFLSESKNPQIFGELISRTKFDIKLLDANFNAISEDDIQHISICVVLLGEN